MIQLLLLKSNWLVCGYWDWCAENWWALYGGGGSNFELKLYDWSTRIEKLIKSKRIHDELLSLCGRGWWLLPLGMIDWGIDESE